MWRKRVFILAVTAVFLTILCEVVSFLVLSRKYQQRFSFQVAAQRRLNALERLAQGSIAGHQPGFLRTHRLHPYLGAAPVSPGQLLVDRPARGKGQKLVLVVGGSVAQGFAQVAGEQLREDLTDRYPGHQFQVWNGGFGGCKQPQQLMLLTYLLSLGVKPAVVINLDGFNEVALHEVENGKKSVFPAYPRSWWVWVNEAQGPAQLSLAELSVLKDQKIDALQTFSRSVWRISCTANLCLEAYLAQKDKRSALLLGRLKNAESKEALGPTFTGSEEELYAFLVDVWFNSSEQMNALCEANDIAYFHFLQPNQYYQDSKPLSAEELVNAYDAEHVYRPGVLKGYPRLVRRGNELRRKVLFRDLTKLFQEKTETLYIDTCCHLNRKGSLLLEEAIFQTVSENWEPVTEAP